MSEKPEVQIIKWNIFDDFLYGLVVDHPRFPAGHSVRTSKIVSQEGNIGETQNTRDKLVGEKNQY